MDYVVPATAGPVTLYVVARDGREGVSWLERTVEVVAPTQGAAGPPPRP